MNRSRTILLLVISGVVVTSIVAIALLRAIQLKNGAGSAIQNQAVSQPAQTSSLPASGFLPGGSVALNGQSSAASSEPPIVNGKPVTSLNDVAQIIAASSSASSTVAATHVELLPLPDVPDGAIAIDPSGAATRVEYLEYFNVHAGDIPFDKNKFNAVMKDKNGVVLFTQDLIDKALGDGDFQEVGNSLLVQKEFAEAEIVFLKSIKVTGDAIALDKKTIGVEELLVDLIDKSFAVASGSLAKNDFVAFYHQFMVTVGSERRQLVARSLMFHLSSDDGWLTHAFQVFGTTVQAQAVSTPFGGEISVPIPCPCSAGVWIVVGPPFPASIFVPFAFMATPLFYNYKSSVPGAWWLGLYSIEAQIPCLSGAACAPIGSGGLIIMAGTSSL